MFVIFSPEMRPMYTASHFPEEREYLFAPNSWFAMVDMVPNTHMQMIDSEVSSGSQQGLSDLNLAKNTSLTKTLV